MPRKAPNLEGGVIEHRMTLGDYERSLLQPYATNLMSKQKALNIQNWVKSGAMVGGVVVVYMGVRLISNTWATINEILDPVKIWTGKEQHEYIENGEIKTRKNSAAGIPILGGWVSMWYDVGHTIRARKDEWF
tara:strand:+ start:328 stop:726 length:399 start_codon:yes stop_codon:yes gene_type:complete